MLVILAIQKAEIRRSWFRVSPRKIVCKTLSQKNPSQKMAVGVAQAVKSNCLASVRPSSNLSAVNKTPEIFQMDWE
jgi:hypothetical protein